MTFSRPGGLAALPARYGPLFDRAATTFEADPRVRGMWVHGAMARGAADAGSDLDVTVAVADDQFEAFAADWMGWLASITPTVTARPLGPGSFYALTPTCERFDVIAERVSALPTTPHRRRIVVFDKDGLDAEIPAPDDPPPDPRTIAYLVEETMRQVANWPVVLVRQDWLMGVIGVQQTQLFLYQLYAESNKPAAPTGPKQWSFKLTPDQRRTLERLPVAAPNAQSVRAARDAAFAVFFRDAPAIAARNAVPWPTELEQAVRTYLEREGVPLPGPARPAGAR
jgi:hypothetical protein